MAFCGYLRQSTAVDFALGPFLDETDGKTAETALTLTQPDIRLKKNAAAWAQKNAAQTLSHEENGYYEVALDTTDTNTLGLLSIAVHESGALPVRQDYLVVPAEVFDFFHSLTGAIPALGIIVRGLAQDGTSANVDLPSSASATDGDYKGCIVVVTHATGQIEVRQGDSTASPQYDGDLRRFFVSPPFATAPTSTSMVSVIAAPPATATQLSDIADEVNQQASDIAKTLKRTGTNGNGGLAWTAPDGAVTTTLETDVNALPITEVDTAS